MADQSSIYRQRPRDRFELQNVLERILGVTSDDRVQYQPPEGTKLKLPNITYRLSGIDTDWGDNLPYIVHTAYDVTIKDKNPDSKYVEVFKRMPLCRFVRFSTGENYNAWTFRMYTQL